MIKRNPLSKQGRQVIKDRLNKKRSSIEKFLIKYKNRLAWGTFFAGFLIDVITLNRIDALFGNIILSLYLVIAILSIILSNWGDYNDIRNKFFYKLYKYTPFLTQFAFGALFSGFVVYYTTSSTISGSWPFLLVLYLLFIANEKFQKYYEKFEFQIAIFFLSLFSFTIFFLPIVAGRTGDKIFIASGGVSLILIYWITKTIFKILPILKKKKKKILKNIFIVFVMFNLAYFFRVIPPVPLSIKRIEVVHEAGRNIDNKYFIKKEKRGFFDLSDKWNNVYHKRSEDKVYAYISVFAPTGFRTRIFYLFKYYNKKSEKWITIQKSKYDIEGGRGGGFRYNTFITNAQDGEWRIDVENASGFLIGRENFEVKNEDIFLEFETEILN